MTRETGEKDNVRQTRQDPIQRYTTSGDTRIEIEYDQWKRGSVYCLHGKKTS